MSSDILRSNWVVKIIKMTDGQEDYVDKLSEERILDKMSQRVTFRSRKAKNESVFPKATTCQQTSHRGAGKPFLPPLNDIDFPSNADMSSGSGQRQRQRFPTFSRSRDTSPQPGLFSYVISNFLNADEHFLLVMPRRLRRRYVPASLMA